MRCGTVNVAGSGMLEKQRYDIYLDPEIQTKIEQGTKNTSDGRCQKDTHIWFGPLLKNAEAKNYATLTWSR